MSADAATTSAAIYADAVRAHDNPLTSLKVNYMKMVGEHKCW